MFMELGSLMLNYSSKSLKTMINRLQNWSWNTWNKWKFSIVIYFSYKYTNIIFYQMTFRISCKTPTTFLLSENKFGWKFVIESKFMKLQMTHLSTRFSFSTYILIKLTYFEKKKKCYFIDVIYNP